MHIATAMPPRPEADSDGWVSVPDAFLTQVAASPTALAVESGAARYSYAELAARVELFAARLAARLVDGDRLVGVCLDRDIDLPAWLLAILRVGGAYLPLDPTLPETRLGHVLEDGTPALIVASRSFAPLFASTDVPLMLAEDTDDVPPAPQFPITPDTLAYVIFTSGSTGRPKGVEIEHGSLAALMRTMVDLPGFARGERMLGLTRISFDLSVPDMFLPFYAGGSLALIDLDAAGDPAQLAGAFERYRPDLVQATPSTWLTLLEGGWQGLAGLRILAGGEAMGRALAVRLLPRCAELWNIYGPTETTVWSTCYRVDAGDGPVPIGWPMDGYDVRVVDAALQPVANGKSGEIVIGGTGVARGYRGRPDLTRDRFVRTSAGERLYRTGDVGRVGVDGRLFCLGRLDDQVKVRGFRIELGDVEAALALHDDVAWCAVRLWTDAAGAAVLTGYVVPRSSTAPQAGAVKAFLAQHLAPYMVPDRIVALEAMPLTPNGKVDRNVLPSPFANGDATPHVPAGNDIQSRLGMIWCDLLGITQVDGDDDFFDLGGYSLMTVRLCRRIEMDFGARLAPIDLLQHSTLRAMARRIECGTESASSAVLPLNAPGERPPLYWLDAGPLMRTLVRGLPIGQPAFSLNVDAADEEMLGRGALSIAAVAERLRLRLAAVQPSGPYYIGGWCRWGIVAYELTQQLVARGESVALLVLLDADRPQHTLRHRVRLLSQSFSRRSMRHAEPESFSQRVEAATHRYNARPYDGDVLLLRANNASADGGWKPLVSGNLDVARSAGDHLTMVRPPHVAILSVQMEAALSAVQRRLDATRLS